MTPAYQDPSLPAVYAQGVNTEENSLLKSTPEAYEVEEQIERNLGRYLAEIVAEQITADDYQSEDRDAAAVEDIYRRELAKLC